MQTAKYHLSTDGQCRRCQAQGSCPLGGEHFDRATAKYKQNLASDKTASDAVSEVSSQVAVELPHWRLYLTARTGEITAVCVQDFDYRDYLPAGFIEPKAYRSSLEAKYAAEIFNLDDISALPKREQERLENMRRGSAYAYADISDQLEDYNQVHWRLYYAESDGQVAPVCVQYFDYVDYDQSRFLGKKAYFSESEAALDVSGWD